MKYNISLIGICILFFALTVDGLTSNPFSTDELSEIHTAQREFNSSFIRTGTPHPPLSYAILHIWNELFDTGPIKTRLPSIMFSIGSIITLYLLTRKLIVPLLFAISPPIIEISRLVDKYALFIFLTILTIYLYHNRRNILLTMSMILLIQTHFYGFFIIGGLYLNSLIKRKEFLRITVITGIAVLTLIPQAYLVIQNGPYDFPFDEPYHDMIRPEKRSIIENFYTYIVDDLEWYGVMLLLISYTIYLTKLREEKSFVAHYTFLVVPLIFLILGIFINVQHYQLLFLLPLFITYTLQWISRIKGKYVFLLAIIIISSLGSLQEIQAHNDYPELSILEEEYQNETIITDGFYAFAIEYYTDLPHQSYHMEELGDLEKIVKNKTWVIYHIDTEDTLFLNNSMKNYLNRCEQKTKRLYYCK